VQSKDAARRLARSIEPVAAALAAHAIADPVVLDDHLEALELRGFGDAALEGLAKQIIRLRLDFEHLDSNGLRRHLTEAGFGTLLTDIDRAAARAGAPFTRDDVTLAAARSQWSYAFEVLNRVAALEDALNLAKADLARGGSASALIGLKKDRDRLRRAIRTGSIWTGEAGD
jgi:DNA primase